MMKESSSAQDIISRLSDALRQARSVTVLTGAGISAESGIPTFRDSQAGLWAKYDPHQLATPEAFSLNPNLVLDWYRWRRSLVEKSAPNPGHLALAELEKHIERFCLITQNVDGLHQSAGSECVIELHGNIHRLRCAANAHGPYAWPAEVLPRCPQCGELLRPDVVWFGESLPSHALEAALQATRGCDLFFSIGTSGVVEPAASLPYEALRGGAKVVEINPLPTPLTIYAQYQFTLPAGQVLPEIVKAAFS